ncbi:MAG: hypothetical protein AAFY71_18700 [Bacteroidota bacterium]
MAKERFQAIQMLGKKVNNYLKLTAEFGEEGEGDLSDDQLPDTGYYTEGIRIDIMTTDMQLKNKIFRQAYIYRGDKVTIPGTKAKLYALADYSARASAGFRDNIKVQLKFGVEDSIYAIAEWIFKHISGRTTSFVIENKVVNITPGEILHAIRGEALLELGTGE